MAYPEAEQVDDLIDDMVALYTINRETSLMALRKYIHHLEPAELHEMAVNVLYRHFRVVSIDSILKEYNHVMGKEWKPE